MVVEEVSILVDPTPFNCRISTRITLRNEGHTVLPQGTLVIFRTYAANVKILKEYREKIELDFHPGERMGISGFSVSAAIPRYVSVLEYVTPKSGPSSLSQWFIDSTDFSRVSDRDLKLSSRKTINFIPCDRPL